MYKLIIIINFLLNIVMAQVDYNSEIQTIFSYKCGNCHTGNSSGGLNLSTYENIMAGGSNGSVINQYDHMSSSLYDRITRDESESGNMPPSGSLSQDEIDIIAQWIDEGALETPLSSSGCTDSEAYNCLEDDGTNYSFEVGALNYVNGCNYDLDDYSQLVYIGGCEEGPCDGYYNPGATIDNGMCDYYQAPVPEDVEYIVSDDGITIDWSNFTPPQNSEVIGYILQRCTSTCIFVTGNPFPWPNGSGIGYTDMIFFDEFDWENDLEICGDECGGEIKYAINVHYSNAESFGMAIGASYINPSDNTECVPEPGDLNGDGGNNVLDIVALANCILGNNCADLENGCAGDLNGDGGYNVLDIVALANCILSNSCGD